MTERMLPADQQDLMAMLIACAQQGNAELAIIVADRLGIDPQQISPHFPSEIFDYFRVKFSNNGGSGREYD